MKVIKSAFLLLLISPVSMAWSATTNTSAHVTKAQADNRSQAVIDSPSNSTSALKFHPKVLLTAGSTSNATLLNVPTAGPYWKVAPSLSSEFEPTDSLYISGTLSGRLKRFSEQTVGDLANETAADAGADFMWFISDAWETGGHMWFSYLENRIPVIGVDRTSAIFQRYIQPEGRLYGAWAGESLSVEVGAGGASRRYSTTTFDLVGNIYRNSYTEARGDVKLGYQWTDDLRMHFTAKADRRMYDERMAEFSDGLPAPIGEVHPRLSVFGLENELSLKVGMKYLEWTPALSFRLEKDEVFGARDSSLWKIRQKAAVSLPLNLTFEPEISLARQDFANFSSDPLGDPRNSPLREDWDAQAVAAVKFTISREFVAQAQYAFNKKLSNYTLARYTEHAVETGMNIQF